MGKKIVTILLVISAVFIWAQGSVASDKDPFAGKNLYKDVVSYSSLGEHRTATLVDYDTAHWLESRLKKLGFSVELWPFSTDQFYPTSTKVTIDSKKNTKIQAFPVWYPKSTSVKGVEGQLTTNISDVSGKIWLFDNPSGTVTPAVETTIKKAAASGAIGVIIVPTSAATPSGLILGQNATQLIIPNPSGDPGAGDQSPWTIPVVTVGRKDRPSLQTAVDGLLDVQIKSTGRFKSVIGYEVLGTLERGSDSKTMIVSTPYSGWFHCGGERGPGIAIWLALAEWAAKDTSGVKWIFLSSSGHELLDRGTNMLLKDNVLPPPEDVYLWFHLGMNVITYNYTLNSEGVLERTNQIVAKTLEYVSANPLIVDAANTFVANGSAIGITGLLDQITLGDLLYAQWHGYSNLLYLSGNNPVLHTPQDLPRVTGPELLEPMARACQSTLEQVISGL